MDEGGVENGHIHIALVEQHADFRATQNKAVSPGILGPIGDRNIGSLAVVGNDILAKLFVDYAVGFGAVGIIGQHGREAGLNQTIRIKALFHGEGRCHQTGIVEGRLM